MKFLLISVLISIQICGHFSAEKAKVICYWPNWRIDDDNNKHTPEDIDPTLCTHIHHAFHELDDKNNVIRDSAGPQPEVYKRLNALKKKNPDLKVVVSLGGAGAPDEKFSKLVNNPSLREQFIKNTIQYLHKYQFDGLDLDWEYPLCWNGDCSKGPESDRQNFGKFVQELRTAFNKETPRFSVSAAVISGGEVADKAYDFKTLGENLDYVSVMTYDDAGVWDHKTGHHSKFSMCISSVQYFSSKGIPKEKVLMGVPFYGHTFKLADKNKHGVGAPILGEGKTPGGEGDNGFYREVCNLVKNQGWTKEQSDNGHDPIAYHNDLWVGYDDPYAAYDKSKWVKDNGFGGIIVWEISQDDFNKKCCSVTYPMLRAISHGLYGTGQGPETYGCEHK